MVNENLPTVNGLKLEHKRNEEIMVPYSRVLYIAWDKDVGARLQAIRNTKGLSQHKLAEATNGEISRGLIQKLEYGQASSISREKLDILLSVLGTDVQSLFLTSVICFPV